MNGKKVMDLHALNHHLSCRCWVVISVALLVTVSCGTPAQGDQAGVKGGRAGQTDKPPPPKCADLDCSDPMFTVFHPPRGAHATSHGTEVSSPHAVYDVDSVEMYGSVDLSVARAVTAGSGYQPVVTDDGRGIAFLGAFDVDDSNLGPYRQIELGLVVNERPVTVATRNPYAFVSTVLDPDYKLWAHKMIFSDWMPVDYGREIHGWGEPAPQHITVRTAGDGATFAATDPAGHPILSGQVIMDTDVAVQADALVQFVTAGRDWVRPFLTNGGLVQVNYVNPDVMRRADGLLKSHQLIRLKSGPVLDRFEPRSTLTANPSSDFGGAVSRLGFRPIIAARARYRSILDRGFAPPFLGWDVPRNA